MTAAPEGEVDPRHVAYLTDRVRLAYGQAQIYGTQVHLDDGRWQPRDLDDPDYVEDRRLAVGLEPLTEYLSWFDQPRGARLAVGRFSRVPRARPGGGLQSAVGSTGPRRSLGVSR